LPFGSYERYIVVAGRILKLPSHHRAMLYDDATRTLHDDLK
jgi:hypothetical protein